MTRLCVVPYRLQQRLALIVLLFRRQGIESLLFVETVRKLRLNLTIRCITVLYIRLRRVQLMLELTRTRTLISRRRRCRTMLSVVGRLAH